MPVTPPISGRKADHLDLCIEGDVGFRHKTPLLEQVQLIHDALPELAMADIDLSTHYAGHALRAPLIIAAMTGGVGRATDINRDLASVAQELGVGFAFGSQRVQLTEGIQDGYHVRDVAPDALVMGNIGVVQAARHTSQQLIERIIEPSGLDALCVHLNPAMEVVQPGGDDDFRGGLAAIERLVTDLPIPIIVKETGSGLSRQVGLRLRDLGVRWVDTSGAGGTSWVGVETHRAQGNRQLLGGTYWDWGIPTAASVAQLSGLGLGICATGGLSTGLDVAHALALGANTGGIARGFLQAWAQDGRAGVRRAVQRVIDELRVACLLSGAANPAQLVDKPLIIGPDLRAWIPPGTPLARRANA